jgi:hypothetical protein
VLEGGCVGTDRGCALVADRAKGSWRTCAAAGMPCVVELVIAVSRSRCLVVCVVVCWRCDQSEAWREARGVARGLRCSDKPEA